MQSCCLCTLPHVPAVRNMKTSGYKRKTDWVEDTSCKCSKTDEADKTACAAHEQRAVADAVSKEPDLTGEQVSYFNGIAAKIAADHYSVALLRSVNKHRLNTTLDKLMHVVDRKQIDMAGIRGQYALSAGVNSRKVSGLSVPQ